MAAAVADTTLAPGEDSSLVGRPALPWPDTTLTTLAAAGHRGGGGARGGHANTPLQVLVLVLVWCDCSPATATQRPPDRAEPAASSVLTRPWHRPLGLARASHVADTRPPRGEHCLAVSTCL